jgi:hypothetical protein
MARKNESHKSRRQRRLQLARRRTEPVKRRHQRRVNRPAAVTQCQQQPQPAQDNPETIPAASEARK